MDKLIIFVPLIVSNIVQFVTLKPNSYAKNLSLQPPSYVFGIVWTIIYLLFGAYLYNIIHTKEPFKYWIICLWILNLILNMTWSPLVFNYKRYKIGVYIIVLMIATLIGLMINTTNIISKNLLIPYVTWLIIALFLNVELVSQPNK